VCEKKPAEEANPGDVVSERAAHNDQYEGTTEYEAGPATMLPLRALVTDPAVVVFALLHVVAAATPWLYRGVTASDILLVVLSYTARMFGASSAPPEAGATIKCSSCAVSPRATTCEDRALTTRTACLPQA
jgi:hypothetical protein